MTSTCYTRVSINTENTCTWNQINTMWNAENMYIMRVKKVTPKLHQKYTSRTCFTRVLISGVSAKLQAIFNSKNNVLDKLKYGLLTFRRGWRSWPQTGSTQIKVTSAAAAAASLQQWSQDWRLTVTFAWCAFNNKLSIGVWGCYGSIYHFYT